MCGIVGFLDPGKKNEERDHCLRAMMQSLAHRGPDGEGTFIESSIGLALGHKRLAIIDPVKGKQPIANEDGGIRLVFNGCIYNFESLMRLLRQAGHTFRTHCDAEVIIHAYEEWGEDCVNRFNGMWAFALWDNRKKQLFCSRDRLGVKPFYYFHGGNTFYFSSEIKAFRESGIQNFQLDREGLEHYLTFQCCLGQTTMFEGVRRLEPGSNLIIRPGSDPVLRKYWDIDFAIDTEHDEEYFVRALRSLLEDAVRLRLRSDVPLGSHLSGGLDSASIVSIASKLLGDLPLDTFTGAFAEGQAYDETKYAKLASHAAGTNYFELYMDSSHFLDSIEKIIWHMDEPAAGPGVIPQYWISRLASEQVKVVLSGVGGDEIFIGYARYLVSYLEECIKGAIQGTSEREHYVATLQTIIPNLRELENYIPMLQNFWGQGLFEQPASRYYRLLDRFVDCKHLLSADIANGNEGTFEKFQAIFNHEQAKAKVNRMLVFDLKTNLQALLQVEDRTSMAHGLESRVPLLDYRLVELMASIPPVIKFKNGRLKHLFRQAVSDLVPNEILSRKDKMGFPVPLNKWLGKDLYEFASDILLSPRCAQRGILNPGAMEHELRSAKEFSRGIWGCLCLELWHRQFIDN